MGLRRRHVAQGVPLQQHHERGGPALPAAAHQPRGRGGGAPGVTRAMVSAAVVTLSAAVVTLSAAVVTASLSASDEVVSLKITEMLARQDQETRPLQLP